MASPLADLGTPVQVAYLVDDVEDAAARFAARGGMGPFFVRHHPPADAVDSHGCAGVFDHSSAYGQWGPIQVELVALGSGTSPSLVADLGGSAGLHHVAFFVPSLDAAIASGAQGGFPPAMVATTASGQRFAFLDARPVLGHFIEVYERTEGIARLYDRVAQAAAVWDGTAPVRPM
ncbi:MAG: VOC family protein [Ilumatobacteraceae bacterium]